MVFEQLTTLIGTSPMVILLFALLALWEGVWKGIALWKSGRHNQLIWFIFLLIFNTGGILPIVYLLFFQKKRAAAENKPKRKRRR